MSARLRHGRRARRQLPTLREGELRRRHHDRQGRHQETF